MTLGGRARWRGWLSVSMALLLCVGIAGGCGGGTDEVPDATTSSTTYDEANPEAPPTTASTIPPVLLEGLPNDLGDDPALDVLWRDCDAGSGSACDELFRQAPVGSVYEEFGYTCGNRPEVVVCVELDAEAG